MNKNEILNYLAEKRYLTAPVALAKNEVANKRDDVDKAKDKLRKTIVFFVFVGVIDVFTTSDISNIFKWLIDFSPAIGLIIFKRIKWIEPARKEVDKALQALREEENKSDYQYGVNGFPQKFYNYTDILRLYNLINEGRADTLKEAYNLLETQHFQEDQASIQEEIRSLQQDTANSAKWSAIASTISAYNSFSIRR